MTTVVKAARATNAGVSASRLKTDMHDLYKLEDDEGALFVTANVLGSTKLTSFECKWHTSELRPKFDVLTASASAASGSFAVTNGTYFQINDLVLVPSTGELVMVTGVAANVVSVTRGWGTTGAANVAISADVMIVGPHYAEGATLQTARSVTEQEYVNQTAIWRTPLSITETLRAVGDAGGLHYGSDLDLQREDMMLVHKRDINLTGLNSEAGQSGTQRSIQGMIPFIAANGVGRVNSTQAVTWSVFVTALKTATRYGGKQLLGIVGRLGAQIVSEWAMSASNVLNVHVTIDPNAKVFGMQVMDITTPHGSVRLLVDDALEGTDLSRKWLLLNTTKKGGPKWGHLRNTRILKNRQANDADSYIEEALTEGTIILGNPQYHYLFSDARTSA